MSEMQSNPLRTRFDIPPVSTGPFPEYPNTKEFSALLKQPDQKLYYLRFSLQMEDERRTLQLIPAPGGEHNYFFRLGPQGGGNRGDGLNGYFPRIGNRVYILNATDETLYDALVTGVIYDGIRRQTTGKVTLTDMSRMGTSEGDAIRMAQLFYGGLKSNIHHKKLRPSKQLRNTTTL